MTDPSDKPADADRGRQGERPAPADAASAATTPPAIDWRLGAAIAALITAWLLWSAGALLNPLLVALFLVFVLHPYRQAIWARRLTTVAVAIALLWLVERLGTALAPFVIAIVVAYFLDPVVDRLEARRIHRSLAILIIMVPVFALAVGLVLLFVPPLVRQIGAFVGQIPGLVKTAVDFIQPQLARFGPVDLETLVEAHLPSFVDPLNAVVSKLTAGALGVGKGIGAGVEIIAFLVVTPLTTFYALRDIDHLRDSIRELIPERSPSLELLREIDTMLGRWLRGQLIVCSALGAVTWLGLSLLGVPYAMLLGLLTGVANIIPLVGFWLSFIPVILVSLTMASPLWAVLKVAVFYLAVQAVESNILSPRIVGGEIGLNPVLMILAIVVFSSLLGFVGVVVAVPVTGVLALVFRRWRRRVLAARPAEETARPSSP